jgi:arylsulfatase A
MAAEGMKLTQHYCGNAVCAPVALRADDRQHPGHTFIRDNRRPTMPKVCPRWASPSTKASFPSLMPRSRCRRSSSPSAMPPAALASGASAVPAPPPAQPMKQGFDRWFGYNCQGVAHNFYPTYLWDNDKTIELKNPPSPLQRQTQARRRPDEAGELQALPRHRILRRSHRRARAEIRPRQQRQALLPLLAHHRASCRAPGAG